MSFRLRYFLKHLTASVIIGGVSAALVYYVWYPGVLAKAVGVSHIFLMMLAIDVTLGPLLTLILAKEGKKGLWFDLVMVIVMQLSALVYGLVHIAEGRPVWKVLNVYRVELNYADETDYNNTSSGFSHDSWVGPKWALVRPAKDKVEQSNWLIDELEGKKSPAKKAELFISMNKNWDNFSKEIQPLEKLIKFNNKNIVKKILEKYPDADGYLPLIGVDLDMTVLMSKKGRHIIKIVDLRPW